MDHVQCFTILWQQPGIQALQVRNTCDEWVDAPPIPGTLVIKYVLVFLYSVIVFNMNLVCVVWEINSRDGLVRHVGRAEAQH